MNYEDIRKVFVDGEAVVILDQDDFKDWGIIKILPWGIVLGTNIGKSIDGERECFYHYGDLALVAQDGFTFQKVEDGDLANEEKVKIIRFLKKKKPNSLIIGDPTWIENIEIFLFSNSLLLVQKGGAQAVLSPYVDFFI